MGFAPQTQLSVAEHVNTSKTRKRKPTQLAPVRDPGVRQPPVCASLAGYHFLRCVGRSLFGEIWQAESPEGKLRSVQVITGLGKWCHVPALNENTLANLLLSAHHPGLVGWKKVVCEGDAIFLEGDWADLTLCERYEQCRVEGLPGIPRDELIGYLRGAAEALDYLDREHGVQHLGLNPWSLWLHEGRLLVADYGLVQLLWVPAGQSLIELNPRYAAPEVRQGQLSRCCDQYSLALIYREMLTGDLKPQGDFNYHSQMIVRLRGQGEHDHLPFEDREPIVRALDKDPRKRFASCLELVAALAGTSADAAEPAPVEEPQEPAVLLDADPIVTGHDRPPSPEQLIADLVHRSLAESRNVLDYGGKRFTHLDDGTLEHKCAAWLPTEVAAQKLNGFFHHWHPEILHSGEDSYVVQLPLESTFWQRFRGQKPALEVKIHLQAPVTGLSKLTEITVAMRCLGKKKDEELAVLKHLGPVLINSLHTYLLASPEHRTHDRFSFEETFQATPLNAASDAGEPVLCKGRNISFTGIGFYAPCKMPAGEISIGMPLYLANSETVTVFIPARIQWEQELGEFQYAIGARFLLEQSPQRYRILMIDDEASATRRFCEILTSPTGAPFELECASRMTQGLERLMLGGVDLVLLDLTLPECRGLQAFRHIRTLKPELPIVVLSTPDSESLALEAVKDGAEDYLEKDTVESSLLVRTMFSAIERQETSRFSVLKRERERIQAKLEESRKLERYLAYHDTLTGLPNRQLFHDRLKQAMAQASRDRRLAALLFIDLDGFKRINDTLGHNAGDQLLQGVAQRLQDCVRKGDTVARLGGDEFTIVLGDIARAQDCVKIAQQILHEVSQPYELDGQQFFVTASIGISIHPNDGNDVATLIKRADLAMYHAKGQGKNNYQMFDSSLEKDARDRLTLETGLRQALEQGAMLLHYQPQVELATGRITGVEALIRWQHPEMGILPPARFIALAEETGLILPIGEWALREACAQNKAWLDAGLPPLRMTVNLSPHQLRGKNLPAVVARILKETQLQPRYLGLEITESGAMQDVESTVAVLHVLKGMGLQLLIDDFGTKYSSLDYLKRFPIDVLKIDGAFVQGIPNDRNTTAIIRTIITLAHSLGLRVIAEQVESEAQRDLLRSYRCDEMQGYLVSRALPAEGMTRLLSQQAKRSA